MDNSVFWDAIVAIVAVLALAVSLYNLREAKQAPALARQRELSDQLRPRLDAAIATLKAARSDIRRGATSFETLLKLDAAAQDIEKIRGRLTRLEAQVALVEAHLRGVIALAYSVEGAKARNESMELLPESRRNELTPSNIGVAIQDLDESCKSTIGIIEGVLKELNRLESSYK